MVTKKYYFTIVAAFIALFSLFGCSSQQRVYLFGYEYEDSRINATMLSADFAEKITINNNEITAPTDKLYLIVDMEATVKDGKWDVMSDFAVHKDVEDDISFDQNLTNQLNGFNLLEMNSTEKQAFRLVFLIKNDTEQQSSYSLIIKFTDGACSGPFIMLEWPDNT